MNETTLLFDGTPVPVVEDEAGGRRRRLITLAAVADAIGMERETLRNIIKRNPEVFDGWVWSVTLTDHLGRPQQTTVLGRDGVLALLLKINTNQVESEERRRRIIRFQRWAAEVLGEVIETGTYSVHDRYGPTTMIGSFPVPTTYVGALRLAADLAEENERQRAVIQELTPKAEFHDRVASSEDGLSIADVAKTLGTGEIRLFRWLRENGILLRTRDEWNLPRQEYLDRGYFKLQKQTWTDKSGEEHISTKTLVTGKGLIWLQRQWDADNRPSDTASRRPQLSVVPSH